MSISVTKIILGSLYLSHISHALFVPVCIPAFPDTTITAASATETASSTSPIKSKKPGVSSILIFTSCHSIGTSDMWIEHLRLISSLSKSLIVFPSSIFPIRDVIPERYAIASVSEVLPQPPCPNRTTFLILSVV